MPCLFPAVSAVHLGCLVEALVNVGDGCQINDHSKSEALPQVGRNDDLSEHARLAEEENRINTANTISSTYAEVAEKYGAAVTGVDDQEQTFELLLSGRIDATLNAEVTYYDYMKAHPDAEIKIACLDPESTKVGIPMKKGDETKTLLEAVNKALGELAEEGTLTELSEKYFGTDISKEAAE